MAQKEAQGVAEKRKGRRGPGSVIGSSAAGCVCAVLSIYGIGGKAYAPLWILGFVASFCTKLSDTVSSEIGKAYGRTTSVMILFSFVSLLWSKIFHFSNLFPCPPSYSKGINKKGYNYIT